MPTNTPKGLIKPTDDDSADLRVFIGENMDLIDDLLDISVDSLDYTNQSDPTILTVKDALDTLLYVPPVINSFTNNVNTVEKGSIITDITFNWSLNKMLILSQVFDGKSLDIGSRSHILSGQNVISDTNYTLEVSDNKNTVSKTTSIRFQNKRYWGTSKKTSLTSADLLLLNNEFATSRSQNRSVNGGGDYLIFAFPSSFGTPVFKVNGLQSTAWTKQTISFTNSKNYTENYDIWRSDTVQNGTGISIDIS